MSRSRAFTRYQRRAHISRKKRIIAGENIWYYKFEGQLSKGKIHCSCPMCRVKSYDCNRRGIFAEWIRWSTRRERRKESKCTSDFKPIYSKC